jgi:ribosomal protein S18 acetylase RimI-like enzyme
MQVEKAKAGNVLEIMYLLQHCIEDFNDNSVYQWNTSYPDYYRLLREVEKGTLYMIKNKGVCIGTVTFDEQQESAFDEIEWKNTSDKFIVIHRIAVFPTWQKKGIGRMLIEFAEKYAKENNYKSIRLDVASSSSHLIKLYESIGYSFTGDILYPKQKEPFKCLEKVI